MPETYKMLAEFDSPGSLLNAAEHFSQQGYQKFETYSPFPIHGMDEAMRLKPSKLGWIVLMGGCIGLLGGFGMQTWMSAVDYKLVISGKPFFSYPAFIPVTFEMMVLFSAIFAVFGMFALNKLPQHYFSLFKSPSFKMVTSHGFFLSVDSDDACFDSKKTKTFIQSLNGNNVDIIKE